MLSRSAPAAAVARLRRVARKPPRYIAWRLIDEARRRRTALTVAAAARGRGPATPSALLPDPLDRVLADTAAHAASSGAFAAAVSRTRTDEGLSRRLGDRAALAKDRRVEVFGDGPVAAGIPPRWLWDIRSGHGWPLGDATRLDYRNEGRPSDVKVAWELSRGRHLVALAMAAAVLEDDDAAVALRADLDDWIAANPMGWSVNWAVGMETALRAVNFICADGILVAAGRDDLDRAALVRSLYQHGWHLSRHLEISDLNGNHFLANAVGLLWLGRYFTGHGEAARWWRRGLEMARAAAVEQIHPDGTDHEGSLPYHVLVLEMFLLARHAAGDELADIDPTLHRMMNALEGVVTPDGEVPDIGDDDGGRILAFCDAPSRDGRRVLELGAAVLGRDLVIAPAWPEDALWMTGETPVAGTRRPPRPLVLRDGGIAVLGGDGDHIVVPCGPVGFRGRGGHGHLDAMAPVAWLGGELVLRDSGTGSYTGDPERRNRLRGAEAHSGLVIDGTPYATIGSSAALWTVEGDCPPEVLEASACRLVLRQPLPQVPWTRTFEWRPGHLAWRDEIAAPAGAEVVIRCQLGLGVLVGDEPGAGPRVTVRAPEGATMTVTEEDWSDGYGRRGRARRVTVAFLGTGRSTLCSWTAARR